MNFNGQHWVALAKTAGPSRRDLDESAGRRIVYLLGPALLLLVLVWLFDTTPDTAPTPAAIEDGAAPPAARAEPQ